MSVRAFYADWVDYNRRIADAIRGLAAEDLALRARGSDDWPIWAIAAHTAAMRVYWLCHVAGEPGAETTPFPDPNGLGWEDDLDTPRSAEELVGAYDSTWQIVAATLERWIPDTLDETIERHGGVGSQAHSRQSILMRLITHEAYHVGDINSTLAGKGLELIDLWPSTDWVIAPRT
jgi:uncharacterized damage-inducible protein DinB